MGRRRLLGVQVGRTLTAPTDGIEDADRLAGAVFAFQWIADDGGAEADIAGGTGPSYTLADADVGKRIQGAGEFHRRRRPRGGADRRCDGAGRVARR